MPYKYVTPNSEIENKGKAAPFISNACVSSVMQITNTYLFFGRHIGELCNAELHPEYVRLSAPQKLMMPPWVHQEEPLVQSWVCRDACPKRGRLAVIRGLNNQQSIFYSILFYF